MRLPSRKFFLVTLLLVFLSTAFALLLTEWIIRRVQPQFTLHQAQLVSPRVFAKSKLIPSSLLANLDTQHIALTREFSVHYTTNSLGYRGPEFTIEKPADTYRVLMLGDSITFGWGVEDNETFSQLMRQRLSSNTSGKKIEIINAGWHDGFAPDSYYVYLKEEGLKLNPDLVILNLFPWNDVSDLREMVWTKTDDQNLPSVIDSTDRAVRGGYHVEKVSSNWKFRIPLLRNSHLAILAMTNLEQNSPATVAKIKTWLKLPEPQTIPQEEVEACLYVLDCSPQMAGLWDQLDQVILGINDLTAKNNIHFIVNLIPAHTQTFPLAEAGGKTKDFLEPQTRFEDFFTAHHIAYLNPVSFFLDQNYQSYFYPQDGHPTAAGHKRLVEAILDNGTIRSWLKI